MTVSSLLQRKISDIAKSSSITHKFGKFLFELVNYLAPDIILEFGTSFGISTLYLALSCKKAKIVTMEGCPQRAAIAKQVFKKLKLKNIELVEGNFDKTLPHILENTEQLDLVFFDGNHRENHRRYSNES